MSAPLRVGIVLFGHCGGHFGRDSYGEKRVEAIGADWVVVRSFDTGLPEFAAVDPENLLLYTEES
jgi:hypothetical protein